MRRFFTLLVLLLTLTMCAWGEQKASFPNPSVSVTEQDATYTQKIWWDDDNSNYHGNLPDDWAYKEFDYSYVVLSGNIQVSFLGSHKDGVYQNGVRVEFSGTGSIEITARNNVPHDGQYFECSYVLYVGMNRVSWDFNSKQYATPAESWKFKETNRRKLIDRAGSSETRTFIPYEFGVTSNTEANYFVPGAPEGLQFTANAWSFGSNNPANGNGSERYERFLAFGQGTKINISSNEVYKDWQNPRIRIKMARAGDARHLTVTNGKDALGTVIDGDYVIGGSQWRDYNTYRDNNFRGEYHFSVIDKNQDFSIVNNTGDWLLLLYVEVYDSPEVISENSILGDNYQLLNNGKYDNENYGGEGAVGTYYLHYYGMGERAALDYSTVSTTGTVTFDQDRFKSVDDFNTVYKSKVGEFGTFRMRLNCWTFQSGGKQFCTDFAWRTQSVGYMQYKRYPYTWDFTDVKPYATNGMSKENEYANGNDNQGTTIFVRNHWETATDGYGERVAVDAGHNVLFCGGSQLWYGQNIIPETAGLGFQPSNSDAAYNSAMTMTSEGMTIAQDIRDWWLWRIIVPQVASDEVVYVRAHRLPQTKIDNPLYGNPNYQNQPQKVDVPFYNAGYFYGDAAYKQDYVSFASEGNVPKMYEVVANDPSGDVIYVIPGKGGNLTLFFSGVTIKKIAVSKDPKAVNIKGWASESRKRVIDPELTGYMTGTNLQTFIVDAQGEYGETVSLTRVDNQPLVMDAVPESGDNHNACIIFNNDPDYEDEGSETEEGITPNKVEILNGKFHLFVPDMHDYGTSDAQKGLVSTAYPNNQLMSAVEAGTTIGQTNGNMTNYVLAYKAYHPATGERIIGKESFYRVQKSGITGNGNLAYLPVVNSASAVMFNLSFGDSESQVDGIKETTSFSQQQENGVYYNLNGQRIQGQPTTRGLYIVNGKKVIIK